MARERALSPEYRERVTSRCDLEVARRAAEDFGVLSTAELRECGLSRNAITTRRRRGQLHQLYTGVWAVGHGAPPFEGRMLAAAKACGPGAVLSHWSAAELRGYVEADGRPPHVTVVGSYARRLPGVFVHRTRLLEARDRVRYRGVPVTSAARTLLDLAAVADPMVVRRAVRTAQGMRQVHVRQLVEMLHRVGSRRGSRRLATVIAAGPAPTRSVLESIALDLLLDAGFEHPDVNKPLLIDGRRVIPDFRWPDQRLILELDGAAWHENHLTREAEAERQAFLEARGERVIRATWEQAVVRQAETVARARAAGAPVACRQ